MPDALIVIDMQNDFVEKGGALYFGEAESVKPVIVDCVKDRLEKGYEIFFTQDWHESYDDEFEIFPPHCVKETPGAELFEGLKFTASVHSHVKFVKKTRFSAFYGTELDEELKRLSPRKIEVCGVVTNICVLFTVEELRNRGYHVVVYENGVASYDGSLHRFSISQMKDVLGAEISKWR